MVQKEDLLWKGIIEDIFDDFLCFVSPEAKDLIDFSKGIDFLDKELEQLFPPEDDEFKPKMVDKLARIYGRDGKEEWLLVHVEVQGRYSPDFGERMFTYYSRIWDKYRKPITAYAVFTESTLKSRDNYFSQQFMGTTLSYKFNTYKISTQSDSLLLESDNPFAMVVLIAKAALIKQIHGSKMERDRALLALKQPILEALISKNFVPGKIANVMNFLRLYVSFETHEIKNIFDKQILNITGGGITMGIEELLLDIATKKGEKIGERRGERTGEKKGEKKKALDIALEMKKRGFSMDQIIEITGLSSNEAKKLYHN